jgi:hypothetical protein
MVQAAIQGSKTPPKTVLVFRREFDIQFGKESLKGLKEQVAKLKADGQIPQEYKDWKTECDKVKREGSLADCVEVNGNEVSLNSHIVESSSLI